MSRSVQSIPYPPPSVYTNLLDPSLSITGSHAGPGMASTSTGAKKKSSSMGTSATFPSGKLSHTMPSTASASASRTRPSTASGGTMTDKNASRYSWSPNDRSTGAVVPPPPLGTDEAAPIEEQYIHNLQQQIYFLEMENQYIRKRQDDPAPKTKSRGTDTGNADSWMLENAAPLEESMRKLKEYYMMREKEHKDSVARLKDDLDEKDKVISTMKQELDVAGRELTVLRKEKETFDEIKETIRTEAAHEVIALQKRIEHLEEEVHGKDLQLERVGKVRDASVTKQEELKLVIETGNREQQKLASNIKDLEKQIQGLQQDLVHAREQIQFNPEELYSAKEETARVQAEKKSLQMTIRQQELKIESLEQARSSNEEMIKRLGDRGFEIEERNRKNESTIVDLQSKVEKLTKELAAIHDQKVRMDSLLAEKDDRYAVLNKLHGELETFFRDVKNDLVNARVQIGQLESKIGELVSEAEEKVNMYKEMDTRDDNLRTENRTLTARLKTSDENCEQMDALSKNLEKQLNDANTEIKLLKYKVSVAAGIENLKLDEFVALQRTNMQVANHIQDLVARLQSDTVK